MLSGLFTAIDAISLVILGILALLLGNTLAMGVRERTQEYGVLRALGFLPKHVAAFILSEAAVLGFRDYWYPVTWSRKVRDGKPLAVTVCGEQVMLIREAGVVRAMHDRCPHRGVPLSHPLNSREFPGTWTCGYHGWTFDLDGNLVGTPNVKEDESFDRSKYPLHPVAVGEYAGFLFVNLDGNAMLFYRASPQWMFVLGVGYWDRVDKIILPYAGAVWNPNDQWELRLLFPKTRISYFLGTVNDGAHWLYASGEYHVESYQISQPGISGQQVQFQDWRIAVGLRSDHTTYDKFVEVGYVFGRNVDFLKTTPGFSINDTFMLRAGVKF